MRSAARSGTVATLINDANQANAAGHYAVAVECSLRALEMAPDLAEAWYQRGMGMRQQAVAAFQEAARLAPDNPDAQNSIGLELLQMDEYAIAESCLLSKKTGPRKRGQKRVRRRGQV